MKYCKKCVMPDTRPGIRFNEEGVCNGCITYEKKKDTDWDARFKELETICDKYRGQNGIGYDCMIAVSGGKDSHFQVHVMKEQMGMTPLLVSVEDNFMMTEAGKHNIKNISEEFGCDIISIKPNRKIQKKLMRYTFEKYGKPTWYIDRLIYTYPLHMAVKFSTPLLVYGENVSYEYGGNDAVETYSAKDQINNGVASDIDLDEIINLGATASELSLLSAPSADEMNTLDPIYLSYFLPWNSYSNYLFAKSRGFHDLEGEWDRSHHVESYDQVDSPAYLIHPWMKYPKFGHASATDYASRFVRYGMLTREDAVSLVKKHDHDLDNRCVREFCNFLEYSETEFWNIVDKFYNKNLFNKNEFGEWTLRESL